MVALKAIEYNVRLRSPPVYFTDFFFNFVQWTLNTLASRSSQIHSHPCTYSILHLGSPNMVRLPVASLLKKTESMHPLLPTERSHQVWLCLFKVILLIILFIYTPSAKEFSYCILTPYIVLLPIPPLLLWEGAPPHALPPWGIKSLQG